MSFFKRIYKNYVSRYFIPLVMAVLLSYSVFLVGRFYGRNIGQAENGALLQLCFSELTRLSQKIDSADGIKRSEKCENTCKSVVVTDPTLQYGGGYEDSQGFCGCYFGRPGQ